MRITIVYKAPDKEVQTLVYEGKEVEIEHSDYEKFTDVIVDDDMVATFNSDHISLIVYK